MDAVQTRTYPELPVSLKEVLRYAHSEGKRPPLLDECLRECASLEPGRVCFRVFPVEIGPEVMDLGFTVTASETLRKYLKGCRQVLLFAATAGLGIDRLIRRCSRISPAKAFLFQAIGAARVEALCDRFCQDAAAVFGPLRPRFSPGYGDVDLSFQKDVFRALDCVRRIGLTLNESCLMSPSKSVTALVGIPGSFLENGPGEETEKDQYLKGI